MAQEAENPTEKEAGKSIEEDAGKPRKNTEEVVEEPEKNQWRKKLQNTLKNKSKAGSWLFTKAVRKGRVK